MRLHQAAVRSFEGMESVPDVMMVVEMSAEASGSPSEARILRCQILGGALHGDFLVVLTFARNAQQNRDREA
jgi:hypothetical protein